MTVTLYSDDVFGVSTNVRDGSYVDRSNLDSKLTMLLSRDNHVAIKGASKMGKSWLRQRVMTDPIVVQCRLGKSCTDIYKEALSILGVKLTVRSSTNNSFSGTVAASGEVGIKLISRIRARISGSAEKGSSEETEDIRQDINNLSFIAEIIKESGRRLVIEDFHYLAQNERKLFAYDLKTFWDFGMYVVVIGIWGKTNYLLSLNSELSGRTREMSLFWSDGDLAKILDKGCLELNIGMSQEVRSELISTSYGNAGILQRLTLASLDEAMIFEKKNSLQTLDNVECVENAAMEYAEELNSVYQTFADRVSAGIRGRSNSTGIYAHALAVVLGSSDTELKEGIPVKDIYSVCHKREPRIQLGNLKSILTNIESLQVDDDGRGLVLSCADHMVRVVDFQLMLYRKYSTVEWPWAELIRQADSVGESYEADL